MGNIITLRRGRQELPPEARIREQPGFPDVGATVVEIRGRSLELLDEIALDGTQSMIVLSDDENRFELVPSDEIKSISPIGKVITFQEFQESSNALKNKAVALDLELQKAGKSIGDSYKDGTVIRADGLLAVL